jgi:hypothetical protein
MCGRAPARGETAGRVAQGVDDRECRKGVLVVSCSYMGRNDRATVRAIESDLLSMHKRGSWQIYVTGPSDCDAVARAMAMRKRSRVVLDCVCADCQSVQQ